MLYFGCGNHGWANFPGMARKLRIQYPGAIYHVINRGNYRRDVFESAGAAEAFLRVLIEATALYSWRVHAYVVMRNHFHLALDTPQPNLVEGMHWLQSTLATRFNRLRRESGHLFQGRYQAFLVEKMALLKQADREVLTKAAAAVRELPSVNLKRDLAPPKTRRSRVGRREIVRRTNVGTTTNQSRPFASMIRAAEPAAARGAQW